MTRPTRIEINCQTGEESIIELTDSEITEMEILAAENAARQHEEEVKAQAIAEAKASAEAKLALLGLTPEEIAAFSK